MKKSILLFSALVAMIMISCKENPYMASPGSNENLPDSMPVMIDPEPSPDPEGIDIPEDAINVHEAVAIARKLHGKEVSDKLYYIKGWVSGFNRGETFEADFPKYGNDFVYLTATAPDAPIASKRTFLAYRLLGPYGAKFTDLETIKEGDFIVIRCRITNFGGTFESSGVCYTYSSTNEHYNQVFSHEFTSWATPKEGELSVSEAEAEALKLADKETSDETYSVRGVVTYVTDTVIDSRYGNLSFFIADGSTYANCYRLKYKGGQNFTKLSQLQVGDTVLIKAQLQNYGGICEPVNGSVEESSNPNF